MRAVVSPISSLVCAWMRTHVCECGVWLCASYVIYPLKKSYFIYYIYLKKYRTQIFVAMVAKEDLEVFIFICYSWFYLCLILLVSESMGKNPVRAARTERCVRNPARCAPCAIGRPRRPQVRCRPPLCKRDTVARSAMQQAGHGRRIKRSTGQGQWQHGRGAQASPVRTTRTPLFSVYGPDRQTYLYFVNISCGISFSIRRYFYQNLFYLKIFCPDELTLFFSLRTVQNI